jgi:hypothetical protein
MAIKPSGDRYADAADKIAFHDGVSALEGGSIHRDERIQASAALIDAYVNGTSETPDASELERLADALLYEELTDMDAHKVTHNEYPILSESQFEYRRNREVSLKSAEEYGSDGRNYRVPKRRDRHITELIRIDISAKIRNKARANQYRLDSAAGPVIPVDPTNLSEPYVIASGLGVRWREQLTSRYTVESGLA